VKLFVSNGFGKATLFEETQWKMSCSEVCRAHLVDLNTGQILKRYKVTHVNALVNESGA